MQVIDALQQAVYGVKEHNRLEGNSVVWSPDGTTLASASWDKSIKFWSDRLVQIICSACG
jgi:WD40 repeat protein